MKTAEEWNGWPVSGQEHKAGCDCIICKRNRLIQLDALREGMRRAAHQVVKGDTFCHGEPYWFEQILTAAEQLTEKDLL